jgi:IS5 family transposase
MYGVHIPPCWHLICPFVLFAVVVPESGYFLGITFRQEPVPDETTILNFRHLLEQHGLGDSLFQAVGEYLQERGLRIAGGTILDASTISAPISTKNKDKARDPEMRSTRKGKQRYFGMKAYIGVDSKSKQIHSVVATAANVYDSQVLEDLLHGEETRVWGDSAYTGQGEVISRTAPGAQDFTHEKGRRKGAIPISGSCVDLWDQ